MAEIPPPLLSPDGRFYWDGAKWVPMPPASIAPSAEAAPTLTSNQPNWIGSAATLAGALLSALGCFLPWIRVNSSVTGSLTGTGTSFGHGRIGLILAGSAAALGIVMLASQRTRGFLGLLGAFLAVMALVGIALFYSDASNLAKVQLTNSADAAFVEVGEGLFVTGLGAIIWGAGSLVSFLGSGAKEASVLAQETREH